MSVTIASRATSITSGPVIFCFAPVALFARAPARGRDFLRSAF
jgi:hypothetical protein